MRSALVCSGPREPEISRQVSAVGYNHPLRSWMAPMARLALLLLALHHVPAFAEDRPLSNLPDGLHGDEVDPWSTQWSALLEGPPGCWEVTGRASWRWEAGTRGGVAGDASFIGRLDNGTWTAFVSRSLGEKRWGRKQLDTLLYPHNARRFAPLIGKLPPRKYKTPYSAEEEQHLDATLLESVFEALSAETTFEESRPDLAQRAVILTRVLPMRLNTATDARVEVHFPEGGTVPDQMNVHFPERFALPRLRLVHIEDAKAQLRGRVRAGYAFPATEAFSFTARVLGMTINGAQTLDYRSIRPCPKAS